MPRGTNPEGRLGFVDQFRGLATIFMIETHVVNALLLTTLETGAVFAYLNFVNGLVAPSFLFVAGFSFTLALNRKGEAYRRFSPQLLRHLKRLVFIWLTGYFLHLPFFSLRKLVYLSTPAEVFAFTGVDILQCIAATLFLLHLIRVVVRDDRKFDAIIYFLLGFFVLAGPVAGSIDFAKFLPLAVAQYFNAMHGSLFPLFPWSGFLIGGTIASEFLMRRSDLGGSGKIQGTAMRRLLWVGIAVAAAGYFLLPVEKRLLVEGHFSDYSPSWFLLRFGLLLVILYVVTLYEQRRSSKLMAVKLFGRESFFVYVVHLIIVYGSSMSFPSLINVIGPRLDYAGCLVVFALLSITMYLAARVWDNIKKNRYMTSRRIQYAVVTAVLYFFISRPY